MATGTVAATAAVELGELVKLRHFLRSVPALVDGETDSLASEGSDESWDESHGASLEGDSESSPDDAQSVDAHGAEYCSMDGEHWLPDERMPAPAATTGGARQPTPPTPPAPYLGTKAARRCMPSHLRR